MVAVKTSAYALTLSDPGRIELSAGDGPLLSGNWGVDLIADTRSILWGTYLREFTPAGITVEEPGRRFDCELRLFVSSLSPESVMPGGSQISAVRKPVATLCLKAPPRRKGYSLTAVAGFDTDHSAAAASYRGRFRSRPRQGGWAAVDRGWKGGAGGWPGYAADGGYFSGRARRSPALLTGCPGVSPGR